MKKKILAAFMAAVMCALLCACGAEESTVSKVKETSLEEKQFQVWKVRCAQS